MYRYFFVCQRHYQTLHDTSTKKYNFCNTKNINVNFCTAMRKIFIFYLKTITAFNVSRERSPSQPLNSESTMVLHVYFIFLMQNKISTRGRVL